MLEPFEREKYRQKRSSAGDNCPDVNACRDGKLFHYLSLRHSLQNVGLNGLVPTPTYKSNISRYLRGQQRNLCDLVTRISCSKLALAFSKSAYLPVIKADSLDTGLCRFKTGSRLLQYCRLLLGFSLVGRKAACSISGLAAMGLRLQPELEDLAVQRPAADFENARGLFFVPAARIEDADDVGALGLAERRQTFAVVFGRWFGGVKKFDVGRANRSPGRRQCRARDGTFELADIAGPVIGLQHVER